MNCRVADYPTRFIVTSESEQGLEYHVNLCEYPVGTNEFGRLIFNGACGVNDGYRTCGCKDFIYRCEPKLKRPENIGKIYRCKHIKFAREQALDVMLPILCANDPNIPEEQQT